VTERRLDILKSWQWRAVVVALMGMGLCAVLSAAMPERLWRAYVFAYMAIWLVTVGGMGLIALGNLTGGHWATEARPYYLAAARTLPLVAILFIPIAISVEQIYPWASASGGAEHDLPPGKAWYLSPDFFRGRALAYFGVWLVVGWWLGRVSRLDVPPGQTPAMRRAGALGLVLLVPTTTFAAFDWGMSLEPHWYSSIYGAMLTACGVLAVQALAIRSLAATEPANATPDADLYNDLGNLLLAFLMVATYFAFSQFLIIWSANLPSEISWYQRRLDDGWQWLGLTVALVGFATPFLLLLSRERKRAPRPLAAVAGLLLVMYLAHLYWIIVPAFAETGFAWQATNLAAPAAVGGGWLAAFWWHLRRSLQAAGGLEVPVFSQRLITSKLPASGLPDPPDTWMPGLSAAFGCVSSVRRSEMRC